MKTTNNPSGKKKHHWYFYVGLVLLILLLLVGGLLGFLTATEYRPDPVEPAAQGGKADRPLFPGESLRVLSFNTGYSSLGWESDFLMDGGKGPGQVDRATVAQNMAGIEAVFAANDADFYMLQEVDRDSHRTFGINQLEEYGKTLSDYGWYFVPNYRCPFVPYPVQKPFGSMDSGVATYSKYQVDHAQRTALPVPFSWPLRIANLKRCMLETRIPIENSEKELVIINFHLEAYDDGEGKLAQTNQLLETVQREYDAGNYVIAGGDFNQTFPEVHTDVKPTTQWVPGILEALPEPWRYVYDDTTPTCRLLNQPYDGINDLTQFYVIDGFILSPNLELTSIETLAEDFQFSDHNPVLMEVTLK